MAGADRDNDSIRSRFSAEMALRAFDILSFQRSHLAHKLAIDLHLGRFRDDLLHFQSLLGPQAAMKVVRPICVIIIYWVILGELIRFG